MIDFASHANRGVKLPSLKQTCGRIIKTFKEQMFILKDRLNVHLYLSSLLSGLTATYQGPTVTGEVSLTCDAWQASNADGYFAVTGHWIEERAPGGWTEEHALLGFIQLNTAHNGTRLGQALYKVCNRLDIIPKVSFRALHCMSAD